MTFRYKSNTSTFSFFFIFALSVVEGLSLTSCKDSTIIPPLTESKVDLQVEYSLGEKELLDDSIAYANKAGNAFSISRLEYYLSDISVKENGKWWIPVSEYQYFDALDQPENEPLVVPIGSYDSIRFNIGLYPALNKTNALPPELYNIRMAWPDAMGGGYHFLKLEGHFLNEKFEAKGYALHVGTDACLRSVTLPLSFEATLAEHSMKLKMDISEWYGGPNVFDLDKGVNYTMGEDSLMNALADNGVGVFKEVVFD